MEPKRVCNDICKKFHVSKPASKGRYESGQAKCQICDIWIDYRGAHLNDGSSAKRNSVGLYCNCCNYRLRRNPRSIKYKAKLRASQKGDYSESQIDLSYFNKQRAHLIKIIVRCIPPKKNDFNMQSFEHLLLKNGISITEIESEFSESRYEIINLAYTLDPPNKISMIAEFERIKSIVNNTPTKQDIDKYSEIESSRYDVEFESWEHMLERLGYDPFYRNQKKRTNTNTTKSVSDETDSKQSDTPHQIDVDRLNTLIDKTLHIIKSSKSGVYMSDIKILLEISQEDVSSIATHLIQIDDISKKEIRYQDILQDVLLLYNELQNPTRNNESENSNTQNITDLKQHAQDKVNVQSSDSAMDVQKKIQEWYDKMWFLYTTSDLSRILCTKYMQQVTSLDSNIDIDFKKKFIALKIHNRSFVGIVLRKSKIVCDFKPDPSVLNDSRNLLRDISDVGSWTSGKSRMNVQNADDLEYCVMITRQCFDYMLERNSNVDFNIIKEQDKKNSNPISHEQIQLLTEQMANKHTEQKVKSKEESLIVDKKAIPPRLTKHPEQSQKSRDVVKETDAEITNDIDMIAQQMIDQYSTSNKLDKSLKHSLTMEYLESRSIKSVIENHLELSKAEILLHLRTPLRLPEKLKELNEGGLHPDPEYSLHIALFATDYCQWDGEKDIEYDVIHLAESLSKYVISSKKSLSKKCKKNMNSPTSGDLSAAIAVWIAVAALHRDHGNNVVFSNQDIIKKITQQNLCSVSFKTLSDHISGHCVANAPTTTSSVHRKIYRVGPGIYRLYRRGEPYHSTREHCKIAPLPIQLPDEYKDLRRWYDEEYCKSDTS